ncbi:MAG: DciA family protein [Mariprofundaceae bacterium]
MQRLGLSLSAVLDPDTIKTLSEIACLRRSWPEIVGPMLAARSEPLSIEQDCLLVAADHPVMAQELRLLQFQILRAGANRCGIENIKRLRTRIQDGVGTPPPAARRRRLNPVSISDCKHIVQRMQGLEGHELRHAFFRAQAFQQMYSLDQGSS